MTGPAEASPALRRAVREIESHASGLGWDQPALLFALVDTAELIAAEPALAEQLGIQAAEPGGLTPVQQEVTAAEPLESVLEGIEWPDEVAGCAAVVERIVLPPEADATMPDDPEAAQQYAAAHPERQDVRMVAAATRDGAGYCALRLRQHDDDLSVLEGPDLVPVLLELVKGTLR